MGELRRAWVMTVVLVFLLGTIAVPARVRTAPDEPAPAVAGDAIRGVNRTLPPSRRLRVLAGDTPVDWSRLQTLDDWEALGSNDVSFAAVINEEVIAKRRKALVVLGSNHLYRGGRPNPGRSKNTT